LPGITGLAQVNNGYDEDLASVRRKLMFDRFYITKNGWKLDLRILVSTIRVVLTGEGAR
ncbi:sugar transferase, partial [bacterium]|nr:sugar transferase [bacterium]